VSARTCCGPRLHMIKIKLSFGGIVPIIPLSAISAVQSNLRYSKRIVSVATSYMFLSAMRKRAAKVDGSTTKPIPVTDRRVGGTRKSSRPREGRRRRTFL